MAEPAVYSDLKAGTFLRHRHGGGRIGMDENMRGSWAYCYDARKDGKPHRGRIGWSGCLRKADWRLESLQVRSGSCAALSHHVAMNLRTGGATRTGSMTKTAQGDLRLEFASLTCPQSRST